MTGGGPRGGDPGENFVGCLGIIGMSLLIGFVGLVVIEMFIWWLQ